MMVQLLFAGLLVFAPDVTVTTLDGQKVTGSVARLSSEELVVTTGTGDVALAADRLLDIAANGASAPASESTAVWIELVDGSHLTAETFQVEQGTASITVGEDRYKFPAAAVRQVRFTSPDDPAAPAWPATSAAADLLAVRKNNSVDFLEGRVGDITAETVQFEFDGESIPVKRSKVDGVLYYHKTADKSSAAGCVVHLQRGWRLNTKTVSLSNGVLEATTQAGPAFRVPLASVTRLDFSAGKLVYLSDLQPETIEWTPLVDLGDSAAAIAQYYAPRRDRSREDGPLSLGGKTYSRGLAISSRTRLAYRLPAGASRFKTLVGIDDAVGEAGHVRLTIAADNKTLFDAPVSGQDDPKELDFDVAGARRLSILVDYGDDLDAADHLDLADARIVK